MLFGQESVVMLAGGLILAVTLMGFSAWLQRTETIGWPLESGGRGNRKSATEADLLYRARRRRSRSRVNGLIFFCGLLILVATLGTPERRPLWIACWLSVLLAMMTIVILAALDVARTLRHYRDPTRRKRR